ncbi:NUDIX hydrolase [Phenylobacterium sp. LjRoot164]|uniref:NUDIX hydrolase n=1 Tax=unclassified Phenylobacterium TaxID=2640670 RepID=UPI003ED0573F
MAALPWRRASCGALEVLLITSRETRRWVIPKGWTMRGKRPEEAAALEALEEAGVVGEIDPAAAGRYVYGKRLASGDVRPVEVSVFPMQVLAEQDAWPEQTQRERRWFAPDEAAARLEEPGLRALIRAFSAPS